MLDTLSASIQRKLKVNRFKSIGCPLCKTQHWFYITGDFAVYVLSRKEFIEKFVRFTCCADEMFLGTVIVNFKYTLV